MEGLDNLAVTGQADELANLASWAVGKQQHSKFKSFFLTIILCQIYFLLVANRSTAHDI
jgi:hypothetical protein